MGAELLAPAGDFETALAAFAAGADAVYCGLADFSARAFAKNFTPDELRELLRFAHAPTAGGGARPRRVYVTFNTLLDEAQVEGAVETLALLEEIGPDALIVQDLGVARLCRTHFPALALHASTQLVAHNLEGVLALRDLGFTRVVLARELSLEEITSIARRCGDLELEVFIHGALCYSLSGLCLFGAMEKGRSGNRGQCPYCCRQGYPTPSAVSPSPGTGHQAPGTTFYPFSMKDLRLGDDVRKLVDAGVASLKIEGRMKSPLYVASVTAYYRQILEAGDGGALKKITNTDLETVFSRRTTELYFNTRPSSLPPRPSSLIPHPSPLPPHPSSLPPHPSSLIPHPSPSPIDAESLGHVGALIGVVKRVTKDRDGLSWLRFHTSRALEKHDGLQFEAMTSAGRHLGLGIVEMRQAISRRPVFEVAAGTDVEILLPDDVAAALKPGMKIFCSMSNAVKRLFPAPAYRPSDYPGTVSIDLEVHLTTAAVTVHCAAFAVDVSLPCALEKAKSPEKTFGAVEKAFSKLGGTDYRLGALTVVDPDGLFAPMSVLNDARRDLVETLDGARAARRRAKIEAATLAGGREAPRLADAERRPLKTIKLRAGQRLPAGEWDEVIVAISVGDPDTLRDYLENLRLGERTDVRLALPIYTAEPEFHHLRTAVKGLLREGYRLWECADLATLRMLRQLGVEDVTADWSLYAFNTQALAQLAELGCRRFVASPENNAENLAYLAESGYPVEFLQQQSTPLFISLTQPEAESQLGDLSIYRRESLWVTTASAPRSWNVPAGASARIDLSWDPT